MGSLSWILILLLSSLHLALGTSRGNRNNLRLDPSTILKTIESVDGEIIDCVDIYKQPASSHPKLANHALQMKPSSYPIGLEPKSTISPSDDEVNFQMWHKNGEYCPEGTIPIVRSSQEDFPQKKTHPFASNSSRYSTNVLTPSGYEAEFAVAALPGLKFNGALGDINVWNPKTLDKEMSAAQLWVTDGGGTNIDSIEAGWTVSTYTNHPTLFVYFTPDDYKTGCFNMGCPGFVQTNNKVALGAFLNPSSTYGGEQHFLSIKIYRDDKNGNWWFNTQGQDVGYWPPNIFNGGLRGPASLMEWGGVIINSKPNGVHTSTEMGSGHFPDEGYSKAAFIKNMKYISDGGDVEDANDVFVHATRPSCYDIQLNKYSNDLGVSIFYGGPGLSDDCK